jgi:hypothetical protein
MECVTLCPEPETAAGFFVACFLLTADPHRGSH